LEAPFSFCCVNTTPVRHRNLILIFYFVCAMLLAGMPLGAQGFLKAQGTRLVDGQGRTVLLRGMGLGGWMLQEPYMLQLSGAAINQQHIQKKITEIVGKARCDSFYQAWRNQFITKADIDSLASWGFNSIRLPMHFNLYTLPVESEPVKGRHTWLREGFARTDSLLRWCAANRIYLILDLHAAPGGQGNDIPIADRDSTVASLWQSAANQEKTIALWKKLAQRYRNEPWIGGYDLLNETNWGFTDAKDAHGCNDSLNGPMRDLQKKITTAIRKIDKNHLVVIEGNCWGNNYRGVLPPWDNNMVLSFHKYWNDNSDGAIRSIVELRSRYQVPVWLGESGENSNAWFRDAIDLVERHGIGWAWWPLKKMGMNNPLELPNNDDFRALQQWWKGKGPKPTADMAFNGLMQLAQDSRTGNNIYHPDVVDALFRQVRDPLVRPFRDHVIDSEPLVYAVHFDMGRFGEAYYTKDSGNYWVSTGTHTEWNRGWTYRNDAVDITACTDSAGMGYQVSALSPGEWLQYTIRAEHSGHFDLKLRALPEETAIPRIWVNGSEIKATTSSLPQGWRYWEFPAVPLQAGVNRLRLGTAGGNLSLNFLQFEPAHSGSEGSH
jgi:endoglucanase